MRHAIFWILGVLELLVGGVLIVLGLQLPSGAEVSAGFDRAERVTRNAGTQVRILRHQVQDLRRPELHQLAGQLRVQTRTVTSNLKAQQLDFDSVKALRDALRDIGLGLDGMAATLDPDSFRPLGAGLGETASFLDQRVVPAAEKTAANLDEATAALAKDALLLQTLAESGPLDLKAARAMHDSLGRFADSLEQMNISLKAQKLDVMRDGLRGMDESLSTGAEQVERLAGYTYPVVEIKGFRPEVTYQKFWPEGEKIATGLRKASAGVQAAGKEMEGIAGDLPRMRTALDDSRKVIERTREGLASLLKQQDQLEPLLKDVPGHAAHLAATLPKIGADLSRVLRETKRLKEVAASLRDAQKSIDAAVDRWPQLRSTLAVSARLLKTTSHQLDQAVDNRQQYEAAMQQTVLIADSFAAMLPLLTDQLDSRLDEEEAALADLGESLDEVSTALPVYGQTTRQVLQMARVLVWLFSAIIGLHGVYLLLSVNLGRRFSF